MSNNIIEKQFQMEEKEGVSIENDSIFENEMPPDRSTSSSAPPALQLTTESIFAWTVEYAKIFSDIRAHMDYYPFHSKMNSEQPEKAKKLPPPLEAFPFLIGDTRLEEEENNIEQKKFMLKQELQGNHDNISFNLPKRNLSNNIIGGIQHGSFENPIFKKNLNSYVNRAERDADINQIIPEQITEGTFLETQTSFENKKMNSNSVWNIKKHSNAIEIPNLNNYTDFVNENLKENPLMNRFELNYSSSPNAQTAFNTANFILKDEDINSYNINYNKKDKGEIYESNKKFPNVIELNEKIISPTSYQQSNFVNSQLKSFDFSSNQQNNNNQNNNTNNNQNNNTNNNQNNNNNNNNNQNNNNKSPPLSSLSNVTDINTNISSRSNIICRYYASGYCSRGEKCFYSHDLDNTEAKVINETNNISIKNHNVTKNKYSPRNSIQVTNGNIDINDISTNLNNINISENSPKNISPRGITQTQEYNNFEQLIGKIYYVSKDQQGCRFLQKKLEEKDPKIIEAIFNEVYEHITELMTDPFGNYLCQKLLEHCNDEQRFMIVERVSPHLVDISKNMHGTRAVQKMIECLSSPNQVNLIKKFLSNSVVELIQDLNGNHVIQRCLNRLSTEDNQFIYDAVTSGNNCIQVATHRHGCCVLQRCIDHASEKQKVQLINEITKNALILVQDPYGNYVVQYVLELPFPNLVELLARSFTGHIRQLATQKFSSNVIEKCLGVSGPETRFLMISEILADDNLSVMLQDPFANYVVQTALAVSNSQQHQQLVDAIKPYLNQLRNTPYGKRIQSKITKETIERQGKKIQK